MFRIIRRTPWIAIGAAAAYYGDPQNGAARRGEAKERLRAATGRVKDQLLGQMDTSELSFDDSDDMDPPLAPSTPADRVQSRATRPLGEERAVGVSSPAPTEMAERILEESEWRVTDRAGTSGEHRRSEDTVPPVNAGSTGTA